MVIHEINGRKYEFIKTKNLKGEDCFNIRKVNDDGSHRKWICTHVKPEDINNILIPNCEAKKNEFLNEETRKQEEIISKYGKMYSDKELEEIKDAKKKSLIQNEIFDYKNFRDLRIIWEGRKNLLEEFKKVNWE